MLYNHEMMKQYRQRPTNAERVEGEAWFFAIFILMVIIIVSYINTSQGSQTYSNAFKTCLKTQSEATCHNELKE